MEDTQYGLKFAREVGRKGRKGQLRNLNSRDMRRDLFLALERKMVLVVI